jgi:hypothetical protein
VSAAGQRWPRCTICGETRNHRQSCNDDWHRDGINAGVRLALTQLDGTAESAVSLLSGLSAAELENLGGFGPPRQNHPA